MSGKRYTEEFKAAAVKQVIDRGYPAVEVAERLGVSIQASMRGQSGMACQTSSAKRRMAGVRQRQTILVYFTSTGRRHVRDDRMAAWLVASRTAARRFAGFWVFLSSNVLWVCWGWQDGAWALIFLNLCLALMNVRGILKNERP